MPSRRKISEKDLEKARRKAKSAGGLLRDEHGCVIGKEIYDAWTGKCVPLPPEEVEVVRR